MAPIGKYGIKTMNGTEARDNFTKNKSEIVPKNRPIEKHLGDFRKAKQP